ncbi:MAG: hypothetical protein ACR2QJ_09870 [Geminicoccaceae bacterium]
MKLPDPRLVFAGMGKEDFSLVQPRTVGNRLRYGRDAGPSALDDDPIDSLFAFDISEFLLTYELEATINTAFSLIKGVARDNNTAWVCEANQLHNDVNTTAMNVFVINNHFAKIDPDAKCHPLNLAKVRIAVGHRLVKVDSA